LLNWHQLLFKDIFKEPGKLRQCGVETLSLDESHHAYLHHKLVPSSLRHLLWLVSKLCQKATTSLQIFALAAFTQFHFVDIHPLIDGNSRMCRLISKYILDSICPLPFPMFRSRTAYLHALENARQVHPTVAPQALLKLLFDEAIDCYKTILTRYASSKPRVFVVAPTNEAFELQLANNSGIPPKDLIVLRDRFAKLGVGDEEEFESEVQWYFL